MKLTRVDDFLRKRVVPILSFLFMAAIVNSAPGSWSHYNFTHTNGGLIGEYDLQYVSASTEFGFQIKTHELSGRVVPNPDYLGKQPFMLSELEEGATIPGDELESGIDIGTSEPSNEALAPSPPTFFGVQK